MGQCAATVRGGKRCSQHVPSWAATTFFCKKHYEWTRVQKRGLWLHRSAHDAAAHYRLFQEGGQFKNVYISNI